MAIDASTVRLPISRTAAHQHHQHVGRRAAATDTQTRARTSTSTPTLTLRHSSGGRPRTSPQQPCCCAAAWRLRPPRSDNCANSRRCYSRLWQHNKRRAPPRASTRSAGESEHHPPTAQIRLLPSIEHAGREAEPRHRRSRAVLGSTTTRRTPSRPEGRLRASTTNATIARDTTKTVDANGATTVTTTAIAAGHRTNEVHGLLARASAMRSSLRASALRPMYRDMIGTPTPVYGSRITGSQATPRERLTTFSSSRTYRSTLVTPRALGSSTCRGTRSTTGPN
jgi:hypothetical protein